jgi:hypothetical protein
MHALRATRVPRAEHNAFTDLEAEAFRGVAR